jgi:hypothetical protein
MIVKSKGHVCFVNGDPLRPNVPTFELFHGPDGTLYGGSLGNAIDVNGYRAGRFECVPRSDGHKEYIRIMFGVDLDPVGVKL